MPLPLEHHVPLAPRTTLELGGAAKHLIDVSNEHTLIDALRWAEGENSPVLVLAGGSNLVIGDEGWDGVVLQISMRGIEHECTGDRVRVRVAAGEPWDELVAHTVAQGWAGLECLSGIPGSAGATPIQNVGAYGQEVADVITAVHLWDRRSEQRRVVSKDACGFGYRDSIFKREPDSVVVLAIELELHIGGEPTLRYGELSRSFEGRNSPTIARVRDRVLELRRGKSMVIDPDDPNRRSAGSFFTNPIVTRDVAEHVVAQARRHGVERDVPQYPVDDQHVKIPAAWLIEASGSRKGERHGAVGLSTRHALAIVHHGGGKTSQLVEFARVLADRVQQRFGVQLRPEPVFAGVRW
ncbi:MAG: UDP-N-acetylmuramate dehydrogenase [Myxococcota bacterium]